MNIPTDLSFAIRGPHLRPMGKATGPSFASTKSSWEGLYELIQPFPSILAMTLTENYDR
jgi:hypothetical protein